MGRTAHRTPLAQPCAAPHACPHRVRLQVLSRCPLFTGLPDDVVARIEQRFRAVSYAADDAVFTQGLPATALCVLASGRVKLTRTTASGATAVVDVISPGQMFGALPTLGDQQYATTATTLVVSCVLRADQQAFEDIVRTTPQVAVSALVEAGRQLDLSRAAVARLSLDSAPARLAETLLDLAERVGHTHRDSTLLQLPLSRADLAAMAGTTPETASRALSRWKADGLIDSGRRWIAIRDQDALRAIAEPA